MSDTRLVADTPKDIRIAATQDEIRNYAKSSDNLIINLNDGDKITVEDFFLKGPNGEVSRLLYADGTFTSVDGNVETLTSGGLGTGMDSGGTIAVAAGLAGLAGLAAASSGSDGALGETGATVSAALPPS